MLIAHCLKYPNSYLEQSVKYSIEWYFIFENKKIILTFDNMIFFNLIQFAL